MADNRTLIVLDGPDFSGKSTLMKAFLQRVEEKGIEHVALREPGNFPGASTLAEEVRKTLIAERDEVVHPETDILLHMGYRVQNIQNVIIPALAANKWVITDRFVFSTWCLNVQAHLDTHPHLADLMYGLMPYVIKGIPEPLTFILNTPRAIRDERAASDVRKRDRYESQPKEILDRIDSAYEQLKSMPSCKFIDGTLPLETQVDIMFETIQSFHENVVTQLEDEAKRTEIMAEGKKEAVDYAEQLRIEAEADESWNLDEQVEQYVQLNVVEVANQLFEGGSEADVAEYLEKAKVFAANMARTVFERTSQDRTIFHPARVGQLNQKVHSMLSWGFARDNWTKYFESGGDAVHGNPIKAEA